MYFSVFLFLRCNLAEFGGKCTHTNSLFSLNKSTSFFTLPRVSFPTFFQMNTEVVAFPLFFSEWAWKLNEVVWTSPFFYGKRHTKLVHHSKPVVYTMFLVYTSCKTSLDLSKKIIRNNKNVVENLAIVFSLGKKNNNKLGLISWEKQRANRRALFLYNMMKKEGCLER